MSTSPTQQSFATMDSDGIYAKKLDLISLILETVANSNLRDILSNDPIQDFGDFLAKFLEKDSPQQICSKPGSIMCECMQKKLVKRK